MMAKSFYSGQVNGLNITRTSFDDPLDTTYRSNKKSMNLGKSTYKRNSSAYSVLENDIATGKSKSPLWIHLMLIDVVGTSRTQAEMIKSLAGLIRDEDNFQKSFRDSVALDTGRKKNYTGNGPINRVNDLIEASRIFTIGQ